MQQQQLDSLKFPPNKISKIITTKDILKEKRQIKTAEQKQQKILEKEQNVEMETDEQKAENLKNKLENAKKKRDKYNENRRLQRLKDKEKINI